MNTLNYLYRQLWIKVKNFLFNLFALFLILAFPIAAIWAMNTLFGLGIDYTIKTYFAAVVISYFISTNKGDSYKAIREKNKWRS